MATWRSSPACRPVRRPPTRSQRRPRPRPYGPGDGGDPFSNSPHRTPAAPPLPAATTAAASRGRWARGRRPRRSSRLPGCPEAAAPKSRGGTGGCARLPTPPLQPSARLPGSRGTQEPRRYGRLRAAADLAVPAVHLASRSAAAFKSRGGRDEALPPISLPKMPAAPRRSRGYYCRASSGRRHSPTDLRPPVSSDDNARGRTGAAALIRPSGRAIRQPSRPAPGSTAGGGARPVSPPRRSAACGRPTGNRGANGRGGTVCDGGRAGRPDGPAGSARAGIQPNHLSTAARSRTSGPSIRGSIWSGGSFRCRPCRGAT
ncbi:translation initiation factor IF-2-like isoform X2 [Amphibalanus amphitrite]|uniref:translation initiation factor IF-2-like isoform X2 n=1 Tax=Amphibalanus amphitrite TaxID=1232801 RepID=UPI001C90F67B|nr:translation initiation factor IF-2-like isoform X2 [Amphibalanus amphitrite]